MVELTEFLVSEHEVCMQEQQNHNYHLLQCDEYQTKIEQYCLNAAGVHQGWILRFCPVNGEEEAERWLKSK